MTMRTIKQLGHNAVLVDDGSGGQRVALGKGLGFTAKPGKEVPADAVEQWFSVTTPSELERVNAMVAALPLDMLTLATTITAQANQLLTANVSPSAVIPIADHLHLALNRRRDDHDDHPLQWEVQQLYPEEWGVGRAALDLVEKSTGTRLPESEAVAIALHIITATIEAEGVRTTIAVTRLINELLEVVSASAGRNVRDDPMATSRFVSHLRYLFLRLNRPTPPVTSLGSVLSTLIEEQPAAYQTAQRLAYLIDSRVSLRVSEEEVAYLTLHVARLLGAR
jgi:beta-glucoside operon transcriptional antiterminator